MSSSSEDAAVELALEAHQVARGELVQDPRRAPPRARRRAPARAPNSDASPRPTLVGDQPGGVQRRAEHADRLGGALRPGRADELDPGLQDLARLPAVLAHGAVGVLEVTEAQRDLRRRVARGDHAGDRDRHVRTQHEHVAVLVEQPVRGVGGRRIAARQDLFVLERRRRDLAVAALVEHGPHRVGDRPQLAQLVREDVARAAGDRVDHAGTRSRFAPRSRRRSSMRS